MAIETDGKPTVHDGHDVRAESGTDNQKDIEETLEKSKAQYDHGTPIEVSTPKIIPIVATGGYDDLATGVINVRSSYPCPAGFVWKIERCYCYCTSTTDTNFYLYRGNLTRDHVIHYLLKYGNGWMNDFFSKPVVYASEYLWGQWDTASAKDVGGVIQSVALMSCQVLQEACPIK